MWDVNTDYVTIKIAEAVSLIWTMWDVNIERVIERYRNEIGFDLNYVGCERSLPRRRQQRMI